MAVAIMWSIYRPVSAIVLGTALLQMAAALMFTILPLQMEAKHFGALSAGLVAASYYSGFLPGCLAGPYVIQRVGHIRAFAMLAAAMSSAVLAFGAGDLAPWWALLRFVCGFCMAGLLTAAESWLNACTPVDSRGRVISFYILAAKLATMTGQLVVGFGETVGLGLFMLASALFSLALIPVTATRTPTPQVSQVRIMSPVQLFRIAPTGMAGVLTSGLLNATMMALGAFYCAQSGIDDRSTAYAMTWLSAGSLVMQWPVGWLSDRGDRRWVIVGIATIVSILSLCIWLLQPQGWGLYLAFTLWGGASMSSYAVCVALANDRAPDHQIVPIASSLVFTWGVGGVIGPVIATAAMSLLGPGGLFFYCTLVALAMASFGTHRIMTVPPVPRDQRERFVMIPATSPALAELDPRQQSDG